MKGYYSPKVTMQRFLKAPSQTLIEFGPVTADSAGGAHLVWRHWAGSEESASRRQ